MQEWCSDEGTLTVEDFGYREEGVTISPFLSVRLHNAFNASKIEPIRWNHGSRSASMQCAAQSVSSLVPCFDGVESLVERDVVRSQGFGALALRPCTTSQLLLERHWWRANSKGIMMARIFRRGFDSAR